MEIIKNYDSILSVPIKKILKYLLLILVILEIFRIPKMFSFLHIIETYTLTRTVSNNTLLFVFTIIDFITILIGLYLFIINRKCSKLFLLIGVTIIFNVFRLFLGQSNIFELNSYEIILSLSLVAACGSIVEYFCNDLNEIFVICRIIVFLCFIFQMFYLFNGDNGNYNIGSIGIGSGGLAILYSSFIFISLPQKFKYSIVKVLFIGISVVGIYFTGSRTNIILFLIFLIIYVVFFLKFNNLKKWIFLSLIISIVFILTAFDLSGLIENEKLNSLLNFFDGSFFNNISQDVSGSERIDSFKIGFNVIKNNPFGISSAPKDLISRMLDYGGTTFPHSYLLCYYLLLGVSALFIYYSFLRLLFFSTRKKSAYFVLISYFCVLFILYGGITFEYLIFFWIYIMYYIAKRNLSYEVIE